MAVADVDSEPDIVIADESDIIIADEEDDAPVVKQRYIGLNSILMLIYNQLCWNLAVLWL